MTVKDREGATHHYYFKAASLRNAKRHAREWITRTEWSATLAGIEPADWEVGSLRRLLAVAGITLAVSGVTITTMIVGLSLQAAF